MRIHALVLAGGSGDRFGTAIPKQFVSLGGEPILRLAVAAIAAAGIDRIVVVCHASWTDQARELMTDVAGSGRVEVVDGGATRSESTRNGLAALGADGDDIVVVHDAARPLVPRDVVRRTIEPIAAGRADAVASVVPSTDTLVVVDTDAVVDVPDRARFRRAQTPQAFRASVLAEAHAAAVAVGDPEATDDCTVVLRHVPGARIVAVAGDELNLKITTPADLTMAEAVRSRCIARRSS